MIARLYHDLEGPVRSGCCLPLQSHLSEQLLRLQNQSTNSLQLLDKTALLPQGPCMCYSFCLDCSSSSFTPFFI